MKHEHQVKWTTQLPALWNDWYWNNRWRPPSFSEYFSSLFHFFLGLFFDFWGRHILINAGHVEVTESRLANSAQWPNWCWIWAIPQWRYSHIESSHLSTRDVKGDIAVRAMTLDAGTNSTSTTNTTLEPATSRGNSLKAVDWLKEHMVGKASLWNPKGTHNVSPITVTCLLESPASIRAKATVNWARRRLETTPTEPLAFGHKRDTVAFLQLNNCAI